MITEHERFRFKDRAELLRRAAELGVPLPYSDDISVLLTPADVAGRRLPNRFVVQPMEGCDAEKDGSPGPLTTRRYLRFAAGGSGLVWFEATAVVPEGRANPRQLWITPGNIEAFRRLIEVTRAEARATFGAGHDVLLVLQLTHSGRYARPEGPRRPAIAQHNPVLDERIGIGPNYPLISDEELDVLQEAYVRAAGLAAEAGFNGVDVKACHGYLAGELLAAFTRSDSRYGGDFENRSRFLLEVVEKIRAAVPGVFVTSRFGVHDGLPWPYGFGAGEGKTADLNLREPLELARRLCRLGSPVLNVTLGNPYFNPHYNRPYDVPVAGAALPEEHQLVGVGRLLGAAAAVQHALPETPTVGAGYSWLRHFMPNVAAGAVARGDATLIGLGRQAIAYPDCVKDLMEMGALDPERTCTACSGCSQMMRDGGRAGCRVHDREVYAEEYRQGRARAKAAKDGRS